jgi:ubiquitin-protein ligase
VADRHAGRTGACKGCGKAVTVPQIKASAPEPKLPPRLRRLKADAEQMQRTFADFPMIQIIEMTGDPPDKYRIEYQVRSLEKLSGDAPTDRAAHEVEIQLTADYPRLSPKCRMLTPIFHPNIDTSTICVGDHWAAGERLVDLVIRIGEMLAFQAYNIKSPLNAEAAMWVDLHTQQLPTDPRPLRPAEQD